MGASKYTPQIKSNKMKRSLITILVVIISIAGGYVFRDDIKGFISDTVSTFENKEPVTGFLDNVNNVVQEVITPPPLKKDSSQQGGILSVQGVVNWTNSFRQENGQAVLRINSVLNKAAEMKLDDILEGQYFAHVSPSGLGPSYWVEKAGYSYVVIGENLALGNFDGDEDLVQAWMDSPGHRENILSPRFQEIGVAVKQGEFEGHTVWVGVQVFGRPLSTCAIPNDTLRVGIQMYEQQILGLSQSITLLKEYLRSSQAKRDPDYNERVDEYNKMVSEYNKLVEQAKEMVEQYNVQVRQFNQCIAE